MAVAARVCSNEVAERVQGFRGGDATYRRAGGSWRARQGARRRGAAGLSRARVRLGERWKEGPMGGARAAERGREGDRSGLGRKGEKRAGGGNFGPRGEKEKEREWAGLDRKRDWAGGGCFLGWEKEKEKGEGLGLQG